MLSNTVFFLEHFIRCVDVSTFFFCPVIAVDGEYIVRRTSE